MRRKINALILMAITLFLGYTCKVNAEEIKASDVPNNTYVIGTHMFTEEIVLSTRHIMLGATTIESDKLSDMIIYYKTPWGEWWDGLSGEVIDTPAEFDISHTDLEATIKTYEIAYNLDGGTAINPGTYTNETESFKLNTPAKEGYVFLGWTGSNGETPELKVIIEEGTTGDLEYTANWALYGDVNIDGSADIADVIRISRYAEGLDDFDSIQKLIADVNLDGEADDVDAKLLQESLTFENITLPYDSGEKYSISYNLDGGEVEERNIKTYAQISLPYKLNTPSKEGYVFLGWTGSNGETPELKVIIEEGTTGDLEYTANWVVNEEELKKPSISTVDAGASDAEILVTYFSIDKIVGNLEIYYATREMGEYTLLKTVDDYDNKQDKWITVTIPKGECYYIKVRYSVNGKYSDYSNVLEFNNNFQTPIISDPVAGVLNPETLDLTVAIEMNHIDTYLEIYYATSETGEYTLLKTVDDYDDKKNKWITVTIPKDECYYIKVRYSVNGKYSDYSNILGFNYSDIIDLNN